MGNHLIYGRNIVVGDIIRIMIGLLCLLAVTPALAQEPSPPDLQPAVSTEEMKSEEKEIAENAEMLQMMELLENMELMEDLDIFNGEDTNEKED